MNRPILPTVRDAHRDPVTQRPSEPVSLVSVEGLGKDLGDSGEATEKRLPWEEERRWAR